MTESEDEFELETGTAVAQSERLTLDLDGWEGPLDLLLTLARSQKVDLAKISILALVEQYLAFISDAKKLRLEIAADYLVMAAWLAYLKSCLLLPKDRRSALASSFVATLELARLGKVSLQQDGVFEPLYVRAA